MLSAKQSLIQFEQSNLRNLFKFYELHCEHVDPPPGHNKQSALFGIICIHFLYKYIYLNYRIINF